MHKPSPALFAAAFLVLASAAAPAQAGPAAPLPPPLAEAGQAQGEFEGRYQVGPTTCTVAPVKMAYEVRWAKGKQAMRFFFDGAAPDGKPVFASEDKGKGRDRFIFDDASYNTGRFVRADGKVFTLARMK